MIEVPSSAWHETDALPGLDLARSEAPVRASWRPLPDRVRHTFTHFHLEMAVAVGWVAARDRVAGLWVPVERFSDHALPTVMRKVARHVLAHAGQSAVRRL